MAPVTPQLEIACFSLAGAQIAARTGVDRIELCDNYQQGGITPPLPWLTEIKKAALGIPVFVMIRPRAGDFVYTPEEFARMKEDIDRLKPLADGFVLGLLTPDSAIDVNRTKELVEHAHPLPCTFHRAFDESPSPREALEQVISTGCNTLLTSGSAPQATQGLDVLELLVKAAGHRIVVMPGGSVRADNVRQICERTGAIFLHTSAITSDSLQVDAAEINRIKAAMRQLCWNARGGSGVNGLLGCSLLR